MLPCWQQLGKRGWNKQLSGRKKADTASGASSSGCRVPHHGAGDTAKLMLGEKASLIPMEMVLHLWSHLWRIGELQTKGKNGEGFVSRKEPSN